MINNILNSYEVIISKIHYITYKHTYTIMKPNAKCLHPAMCNPPHRVYNSQHKPGKSSQTAVPWQTLTIYTLPLGKHASFTHPAPGRCENMCKKCRKQSQHSIPSVVCHLRMDEIHHVLNEKQKKCTDVEFKNTIQSHEQQTAWQWRGGSELFLTN